MSAEDCRQLRGELAAFALDRAEPEDRTRVVAHLDLSRAQPLTAALASASSFAVGALPPVALALLVPKSLRAMVTGR